MAAELEEIFFDEKGSTVIGKTKKMKRAMDYFWDYRVPDTETPVADFEKEVTKKKEVVKQFRTEPKEVRGLRLMDELQSFYDLEREIIELD